MKRTRRPVWALAFVVLALASPFFSAAVLSQERAGAVVDADGRVVLATEDYEASFTSGGARVEMSGRDGPASLTFRLREVRSGGSALFDEAAGSPLPPEIAEDGSVLFRRGEAIAEVYEDRGSGVEQLFRIAGPLPEGAGLRIVGAVGSELAFERVPGVGIQFGPASGEKPESVIAYGEPALVDAAGRRVAGELSLEGGDLVISFLSERLSGLDFPVVVDPLLGANFTIVTTFNEEQDPAVAWNAGQDEFLVIWQEQSGSDWNIRGRRVRLDGTNNGPKFDIAATGVVERNPDAAYSTATNRYVVVYEKNNGDIGMTVVTSSATILGSYTIDSTGTSNAVEPRVVYRSGDAFDIVWSDADNSNPKNQWILCERRNTSGTVIDGINDAVVQTVTGTAALRRPAIAYNATDNQTCIAWEHIDGSARASVRKADVTAVSSTATILSTNGRTPAVSWSASRNEYLTVFADSAILPGGDPSIFMQAVHATGTAVGQKRGGIRVVEGSSLAQSQPAIRYCASSDEHFIAYTETATAGDLDSFGQPIRSDGWNRGARLALNDDSSKDSRGTGFAAADSSGAFFAAFERKVTGTADWNLYGQAITDTSPRVLASDPPPGATNVPRDYPAKVFFSDAMKTSTINTSNCKIINTTSGQAIAASVTYSSSERSVLIVPSVTLVAERLYEIQLTNSVKDSPAANNLTGGYSALFTTGAGIGLVDTDHDGLLDLEEALLGTSPTTATSDADLLTDLVEVTMGTDPLRVDTDGDGTRDDLDASPLDPTIGGVAGYDGTKPRVVAVSPAPGLLDQEVTSKVYVSFSEAITATSVVYGTNVKLQKTSGGALVTATASLQGGNRTIKITPTAALLASTSYTVFVLGGVGSVTDPAGNTLTATTTTAFTTAGAPGGGSPPQFEPLHHPSLSQSLGAGLPALTFAGGGVADVNHTHPMYANPSGPSAVIAGCTGCETCDEPEDDFGCSGVRESFGVNGTHVTLQNGAFVHGMTDLRYRDRSRNWVRFTRTYRSNLEQTGMLGERWTSNWETELLGGNIQQGSSFTLRTGDGRRFTASWVGGSQLWALPDGFYARFYPTGTALNLIYRNGLTLSYSTGSGKLQHIRDRNGQMQTLTYTAGVLTGISDATGRMTTLAYSNSLLQSITSYDGKTITAAYNGASELTSITYPPTDEFPTGRKIEYSYTGASLLETIKNGRGEVTLLNYYGAGGEVQRQDHIDGTIHYHYDFDNPDGALTTVIDRMGTIAEVIHEANGSPKSIHLRSRGANPLDSTADWDWSYTHTTAGEVSACALPRGNAVAYKYGPLGHMIEKRLKTSATAADNDTNDIIEKWKIDPLFGQVQRYMEPRANAPALMAAQRVALTRFYFYDHEDISARLTTETAEMGSSVAIVGAVDMTYGRTGGGTYPAPTTDFADMEGDGLPDRGGNLWIEKGPTPKGLVINEGDHTVSHSGAQPIEECYSYSKAGQVLIHRDPLGNRSRTEYYSAPYGANNPAAGYVRFRVQASTFSFSNLDFVTGDPGAAEPTGTALPLITEYEHDARGNTTSVRSPRGAGRTDNVFRTQMTFDANNLLRTRSVSTPFSYQWSFFYDGNLKLVEERTPNIVPVDSNGNGIQDGSGEQGEGSPGPYFRTTFTYCKCNDVLSQTVDAGGLALTTAHAYDLNQNRVYTRDPFGNTSTEEYDERNQVMRSTRGANDTATSTSMRFVYDANGNQVAAYDDDEGVDEGDTPTVTTFDLFDRPTKVTDELGNESETVYDKGSFALQHILRGPDGPEGSNEILAQSFTVYDEAGRPFQTDRDHFDATAEVEVEEDDDLADGVLVPPVTANEALARGNLNSSVTIYDAAGRVTHQIDDGFHITENEYDAANRMTQTTDPRGNATSLRYDEDGHVIDVLELEEVDVGLGTGPFLSRTFYDQLGRPFLSTSNLGNATRRLYDSRNNVIETADAQANDGATSAKELDESLYKEHLFDGLFYKDVEMSGRGNRVRNTYDGAGRLTKTERYLTTDGSGDSAIFKTITTLQAYDKASRLISQTDDNGNVTSYGYDAQSRRISVTNADGTVKRSGFDRAGNLRMTRDERGVVVSFDVDELGRRTSTEVKQLPFGPGQTSYELFQYDGASRMVYGENNHSMLLLKYDSLGPVISEDQTINVGDDRDQQADSWPDVVQKVVTSTYDGEGNQTSLKYPGGMVVTYIRDANDRVKEIRASATTVTSYMYAGAGARVLEKHLPQPGVTLFRGYDDDRRVTLHDQRPTGGGTRLAGFSYAWDRTGNRWFERTLTNNTNTAETGGGGEAFAYDSAYRMTDYQEGVSSAQLDAITSNSPRWAATPTGVTRRAYALDGVGNRSEVQKNGVVESAFRLDGNDFKTNQYTWVDDTPQSYDKAGNLLSDGTWQYSYSARNQLIQASSGTYDVRYYFDVMGRRVHKRMVGADFPGLSYRHAVYAQSGARILEEYGDGGNRRKQWVYGIGIDEPVRQIAPDYADIDSDLNTSEDVSLWYLTNSIGTVKALVGSAGVVRERYVMDVWGVMRDVIGKTGASTGQVWTVVGNPWGVTGRQGEVEERNQTYHSRSRQYSTVVGQFLQRDGIPVFSYPNLRIYPSNPANFTDPTGHIGVTVNYGPYDLDDESTGFWFIATIYDGPADGIVIQHVRVDWVIIDRTTAKEVDKGHTELYEWFKLDQWGALPPIRHVDDVRDSYQDSHRVPFQRFVVRRCEMLFYNARMDVAAGTFVGAFGADRDAPAGAGGIFHKGYQSDPGKWGPPAAMPNSEWTWNTFAPLKHWAYDYFFDGDNRQETLDFSGLGP